jgi:hypothetical protein
MYILYVNGIQIDKYYFLLRQNRFEMQGKEHDSKLEAGKQNQMCD